MKFTNLIYWDLSDFNFLFKTLEKRDAERLKAEKFNQTVLYATCGLAGFAIVVAFAASRASTQLSYNTFLEK